MNPKQRKSKAISLVLMSALPVLPGCGGCGGTQGPPQRVVYVDEFDPPPDGPEMVVGPLYPAWWYLMHPPRRVARTEPHFQSSTPTHSRSYGSGWVFFRPSSFSGSSSYHPSSSSSSFRPSSSSSVTRGGFGSSGSSLSGSS